MAHLILIQHWFEDFPICYRFCLIIGFWWIPTLRLCVVHHCRRFFVRGGGESLLWRSMFLAVVFMSFVRRTLKFYQLAELSLELASSTRSFLGGCSTCLKLSPRSRSMTDFVYTQLPESQIGHHYFCVCQNRSNQIDCMASAVGLIALLYMPFSSEVRLWGVPSSTLNNVFIWNVS